MVIKRVKRVKQFSILVILIKIILTTASNVTKQMDSSNCKLTIIGSDYEGSVSITSSGVRCQAWSAENPIHEVDKWISHRHFPDGNKFIAKNYCRNPNNDPKGPWCYTIDPNIINEDCIIPLCDFGECRISGPGSEYSGDTKIGSTKKECKYWDQRHHLEHEKEDIMFPNKNFPENSRTMAENHCRNPDGDPGGPWCYVDSENIETVHKEYCDIPFCDDRDCLVYTRESDAYSIITKMNYTVGNITIWLKFWNPADQQKTGARMLFSHLPIPTLGKNIADEWKAGTEIIISNIYSGMLYPDFDVETNFEVTPRILSGKKWAGFVVSWSYGLISVYALGSTKPLFMQEYGVKNSTTDIYPDGFFYYGITGGGLLWSMDSCQEACEVHTTFGEKYQRVWPIRQIYYEYTIEVFVRAFSEFSIQLYMSPAVEYPCITIKIAWTNKVLVIHEDIDHKIVYISETFNRDLLGYWEWRNFLFIFWQSTLHILIDHNSILRQVLFIEHPLLVHKWRWFSISSVQIVHWTLYCTPEEADAVEEPTPPNCMTTKADEYSGTQWFAMTFNPCIPWISKHVPENEKKDILFPEQSVLNATNKCRNPTNDPDGPYCYIMIHPFETDKFHKQGCTIRKCRSADCRMAGTANDYIGTLAVTHSGRECAPWLSDYDSEQLKKQQKSRELHSELSEADKKSLIKINEIKRNFKKRDTIKPIHPVNPEYFNDTLYPERNVKDASNYCRDPSQSAAGTWCYTTDPLVPQDLCDVKDCDMAEQCINFINGSDDGRRMFILPQHRMTGLIINVKIWVPTKPDYIAIIFTADDGLNSAYKLVIGANNNSEIALYYRSEVGDFELVNQKTLAHILYIGKWSNFLIKIPRGKVQVYHEGALSPFFDWTHPEPVQSFLPIYYYFSTERNIMAVTFDCVLKCHVEITTTNQRSRILPISIGNEIRHLDDRILSFVIRANGIVEILLFLFPEELEYYALRINEEYTWISLLKIKNSNISTLYQQKVPVNKLLDENNWTNITIIWMNHTITVLWNDTKVFNQEHTHPLLFYFFSVIVGNENKAIWTANCLPPDIDGDPEDGEWSEWGSWTCSASCNGGVGTRKRVCNNPEPNIKGEPCLGPSIMTGRCNTIACGDLTEDTVSLIRRRKRTNFTAIVVKENQPTLILPDADIIARIDEESPNSDVQWSHDGIIIKEDNNRIFFQNYTIEITKTRVQDSGIYAISVRRVDGTHLILKVISLSVQPIQTKLTIRETMPMTIICRCVVLGYVYANLKISWLINKKAYKNYGISVPITVNVDTVLAINQSHNGLWECQVREDDLRFIWTTNAILVNVISAPNWRSYLMEDEFTKPLFGWMPNETFVAVSVILMFIIIISAIFLGLYYYLKFQDRLKGGMSAYLKRKKINKKNSKPVTTQWQNNLRRLIRRFSPSLKLSGKIKNKKTKTEEEVELLGFDNTDENT